YSCGMLPPCQRLLSTSLYTVSQSDCYVTLWLPTATCEKQRTKTVNNCKDPVWNETFYYRIQSQIKNVLELGVYDEDAVSTDDHLFTLYFDVARLPLGEKVLMHLKSEPEVSSEIAVFICDFYACVYFSHCSNPNMDVRLGYDLCSQEQDFLCKRKKYVACAVKQVLQLEEDLQDHEIPVVGLMATGGGTRSWTATYGSLRALRKLNLLNCITYISGLSGTSWTLASLYRDAYWSQKDLDEQISEARKQVTKSKLSCFSMERLKYFKNQLNQRKQEGYKTTFIDLWGLIIEYLLNDGKDNHKLSDQREALADGQNPLPIYVTINIKDKYSSLDFKEWMEFTPYEVGFLKYGAFVCPENFGSEFFMGRLINKLPETRMCYLHGMWSSIFSVNLLYIWGMANSSEDFWHRWTRDRIVDIEEEPNLPTRPHELTTRMFTPEGRLSNAIRGALTDRLSIAQYHNFMKGFQLHNSYLENESFCRWKATVLDSSPNQLTEQANNLGPVDAGFFINTSCPPLLRPERKVDVILHLSFSAGSQSEPLEKACKYYAEQGIPFPKVLLSEDEKKNLKECYLFDDAERPECPVLVFFPLVNDTFQYYKAPGVKRCDEEMDEGKVVDFTSTFSPYSTYALTYSEENYNRLVSLSEYNILNNQHLILQALQIALERKRHCYKK
uniref:Phospholipase A2 n=1 Tax=Sphenodon punctatus TaxID=8508 RepID=A0A8D0HMP2_SPHPU